MNYELGRRRGGALLLFVFLLPFSFLLIPLPADAQLVPCGGPGQKACTISDLFTLAANIFNWLLGLAAVVAILIIVLAGLGMLTYQFFENPETVLQGAKYTLTRAIAGLVIVAAAFLVVNTLLIILNVNADGALGKFLRERTDFLQD